MFFLRFHRGAALRLRDRATALVALCTPMVAAGCRFGPCTGFGPADCAAFRAQERRTRELAAHGWSAACAREIAIDYRGGPDDRAWLDRSIEGCSNRIVDACTVVAKAYAFSCRVDANPTYATALFRWSCAAGDLGACHSFERFSDDPGDRAFAGFHIQRLFELRCVHGEARACRDLARMTWNGYRGSTPSRSGAIELLKPPCAARDPESCEALVRYYEMSRDRDSAREARAIFESWCTPAHRSLGWPCQKVMEQAAIYQRAGQMAAAERQLRIACSAGQPLACEKLSDPPASSQP
jgi:TPR repeat protein